MAELEIYIDKVPDMQIKIRDIEGSLVSGDYAGRFRVYDLGNGELVFLSIKPDGRTATVKCGESTALILEQRKVISFSQPDPDIVVLKPGISQL